MTNISSEPPPLHYYKGSASKPTPCKNLVDNGFGKLQWKGPEDTFVTTWVCCDNQLPLGLTRFNCETSSVKFYQCSRCNYKTDFAIDIKCHTKVCHLLKQGEDGEILLSRNYICKCCKFTSYSVLSLLNHILKDCPGEQELDGQFQKEIISQQQVQLQNASEGNSVLRHLLLMKNSVYYPMWMKSQEPKLPQVRSKTKRSKSLSTTAAAINKLKRKCDGGIHHCLECGFKNKHNRTIRRHIYNNHLKDSDIMWWPCNKCDYKAKDKNTLNQHNVYNHLTSEEINWFKCDKCTYKGKSKYQLIAHVIRNHLNADEIHWFECPHCDYKVKIKWDLQNHIVAKHSNDDKIRCFKCEECNYKAKMKQTLKKHVIRKHKNVDEIKWFECEKCDYKSKTSDGLSRHKTLYHLKPDEVRWFHCDQCEYKSKTKVLWRMHLLRKHNL